MHCVVLIAATLIPASGPSVQELLDHAVVIEGNTIRGCPQAGIFVAAAKDVQIRNNRLEKCFYRPGESAGKGRGLAVSGPIDAQNAQDVTIKDNEIIEPGQPLAKQ